MFAGAFVGRALGALSAAAVTALQKRLASHLDRALDRWFERLPTGLADLRPDSLLAYTGSDDEWTRVWTEVESLRVPPEDVWLHALRARWRAVRRGGRDLQTFFLEAEEVVDPHLSELAAGLRHACLNVDELFRIQVDDHLREMHGKLDLIVRARAQDTPRSDAAVLVGGDLRVTSDDSALRETVARVRLALAQGAVMGAVTVAHDTYLCAGALAYLSATFALLDQQLPNGVEFRSNSGTRVGLDDFLSRLGQGIAKPFRVASVLGDSAEPLQTDRWRDLVFGDNTANRFVHRFIAEGVANANHHAYPGSRGPWCVVVASGPTMVQVAIADVGIGIPNGLRGDDRKALASAVQGRTTNYRPRIIGLSALRGTVELRPAASLWISTAAVSFRWEAGRELVRDRQPSIAGTLIVGTFPTGEGPVADFPRKVRLRLGDWSTVPSSRYREAPWSAEQYLEDVLLRALHHAVLVELDLGGTIGIADEFLNEICVGVFKEFGVNALVRLSFSGPDDVCDRARQFLVELVPIGAR